MYVTTTIRGAWHLGLLGTLDSLEAGIATVRFEGHGTISVPADLVRVVA